jgi:hypothetical protein
VGLYWGVTVPDEYTEAARVAFVAVGEKLAIVGGVLLVDGTYGVTLTVPNMASFGRRCMFGKEITIQLLAAIIRLVVKLNGVGEDM